MIARLVGAALVCAVPATAWSHGRTASYSQWEIELSRSGAHATVQLELPLRVATAVPEPARAVQLRSNGHACALVGPVLRLASAPGVTRSEWQVRCSAAAELSIDAATLLDPLAGHIHFATVRIGDAERSYPLSGAAHAVAFSGPPAPVTRGAQLRRFATMGAFHVLGGADHLVFLLALVVVAVRLRDVAIAITGFTLGHAAALTLAATGAVTPDADAIEALIGLSIVLIAIENAWVVAAPRGPVRWLPAAVAAALAALAVVPGVIPATALVGCAVFAGCQLALSARTSSVRLPYTRVGMCAVFGVVHGFGFAGALIRAVRAESDVVVPLLGFNAGIELAQLALVGLVWPVLLVFRRHRAVVVDLASAVALAAGCYWFVTRAW